jgi:hypothetical protein
LRGSCSRSHIGGHFPRKRSQSVHSQSDLQPISADVDLLDRPYCDTCLFGGE